MPRERGLDRRSWLQILQGIVLAVAALYFGKQVLLPLAMAVLLAFLLAPVVNWFERRRFGRVPSVVVVMAGIVSILGVIGWTVGSQLVDLAENLPTYEQNLKSKIASLRGSDNGVLKNLEQTVSEVSKEIEKKGDKNDSPAAEAGENGSRRLSAAQRSRAAAGGPLQPLSRPSPDGGPVEELEEAQLVRVVPEDASSWDVLKATLTSAAAPAASVGVVFVLVVFMLITREELRNRLVRLAGTGRITLTTKTLDEVQRRISRYLLMNALVNGGFGAAVGVGLLLMGVDYALLWGFLAAVLRFLPYVGPILASILPIGMAFIQTPFWGMMLMVIGLFIVLELVTNNLIEPLAYGRSAGVSTVAVLVAATFWTWIWGPVGLMLSVPMTVVLAVLGKHVPQLEPLGVLLGDEPALATDVNFYQRLLAGDQEEAYAILEEQLKQRPLVEVYDRVIIPALTLAERDRQEGELDEHEDFIWETTRELLEEMPPAMPAAESAEPAQADLERTLVVGCAAQDAADELALTMLKKLLAPQGCRLDIVPRVVLVSEMLELFAARMPDLVCISALGPGGVGQMRYLTKRIRLQFPDLKILVGRWGYSGDAQRMAASIKSRGASQVVTTMAEALEQIRCGTNVGGQELADRETHRG
ncbi:MAG: AI-2E family transporter [Pirellulales bacterium]